MKKVDYFCIYFNIFYYFSCLQSSSPCGYKNSTLTLKDREWICPECGRVHDRDVLAANNILGEGIHLLESNCKSVVACATRQLH